MKEINGLKPKGKYLKSYESGYRARHNGESINTNPNRYAPDVGMSSWWESGWNRADIELMSLKMFEDENEKGN